jgi:hypothetical protein
MVQIDWLGGFLNVQRLVLGRTLAEVMGEKFRQVAETKGLAVSGEETEARRGDLWVGCFPHTGWTEVRSGHIGLVRPSDESLILTLVQLRRAAVLADEPPVGLVELPLLVELLQEQRQHQPPQAVLQAADL